MITDNGIAESLFILSNLGYFMMLMAVYIGLSRLRIREGATGPTVSVVVAARNEEDSIEACLESLAGLDYPEDKYEIIIVDDHSQDLTPDKIISFCTGRPNWNYILLEEKSRDLRGKKNALLHGIAQAQNDLIFTTDADCVVPAGWLRNMVGYFSADVSMVLGFSPLERGTGFLYRFLQFDNLFSAIVSAAPVKLGYPFTSVGRNLAYRRKSYEDAGGFLALKKFKSGDDVHLTERFRYLNTGKIDFCANPATFVMTRQMKRKSDIIQQQIRKNSKTLKTSKSSVMIALLIFMYYLSLIVYPVLVPEAVGLWAGMLLIKGILEFIDLRKAARIFGQTDLIPFIPLMQLVYPFHIISFSILGTFQLYRWKK